MAVKHATQAIGTNDGTKQVSKDAWNESHVGLAPDDPGDFTPEPSVVASTLTEAAPLYITTTANSNAAADRVFACCVRGDGDPQLQVNGVGSWAESGAVRDGDGIAVRLTSSPDPSTAFTATLYIDGGVSSDFVVTTEP